MGNVDFSDRETKPSKPAKSEASDKTVWPGSVTQVRIARDPEVF